MEKIEEIPTIPNDFQGSTLLSFICNLTSLPIDKVNFVSCQIFGLFLSIFFKIWIKDLQARLWYCFLAGVFICYFCFGYQIIHILLSATLSFAIIRTSKSEFMPWMVFTVSMSHLSYLHLKRQFFDTVSYSLDITGPMMVFISKVTSLAFSVRDGIEAKKNDGKPLTEFQKKYVTSYEPTVLEFYSYVFLFQTMLAGPFIFYEEFLDFMKSDGLPSPLRVVIKKLVTCVCFALFFLKIGPHFYIKHLKTTEFLDQTSFLYKMFYITCATTLERAKYYHAWVLAEAVCNASGLGFDKVKKTWDLVTNVDAYGFEFGLNLKESLDSWNIGTGKWLRFVVYERANVKVRTLATYMTSAMWHGFFPGYYITFLSGAIFTAIARKARRHLRPHFLGNKILKGFYDVMTWFATRTLMSYVTFTFILLDFVPCFMVYFRLYFFMHIIAFVSMLLIPYLGNVLEGLHPTKNTSEAGKDQLKNGIETMRQFVSDSGSSGDSINSSTTPSSVELRNQDAAENEKRAIIMNASLNSPSLKTG